CAREVGYSNYDSW
nr:immunoglobulin heavy chain junction region [Macaca mulatta]